jgi:hypothetical protein
MKSAAADGQSFVTRDANKEKERPGPFFHITLSRRPSGEFIKHNGVDIRCLTDTLV